MPYNVPLKIAIVESRLSQRALSTETRIPEARLSNIVHGRTLPTKDEKRAIARLLRRPINALFPDDQAEQIA